MKPAHGDRRSIARARDCACELRVALGVLKINRAFRSQHHFSPAYADYISLFHTRFAGALQFNRFESGPTRRGAGTRAEGRSHWGGRCRDRSARNRGSRASSSSRVSRFANWPLFLSVWRYVAMMMMMPISGFRGGNGGAPLLKSAGDAWSSVAVRRRLRRLCVAIVARCGEHTQKKICFFCVMWKRVSWWWLWLCDVGVSAVCVVTMLAENVFASVCVFYSYAVCCVCRTVSRAAVNRSAEQCSHLKLQKYARLTKNIC